jgi:hypothetical protein
MMTEEQIIDFCTRIKSGLGSIVDSSVKREFERIYEVEISSKSLGLLLFILEKHDLLDKSRCVNSAPGFYSIMYEKMLKESH